MAVLYISCVNYVSGKRFRVPRRALDNSVRGYEVFDEEGLVKCFYADDVNELGLRQFAVPEGAKEMEFMEMDFYGEKVVGGPVYYDDKGNLLKMGNH